MPALRKAPCWDLTYISLYSIISTLYSPQTDAVGLCTSWPKDLRRQARTEGRIGGAFFQPKATSTSAVTSLEVIQCFMSNLQRYGMASVLLKGSEPTYK